ncbi:hypothetical protein BH09BAC2_BH09BAC2_02380 [soil metagenome]
MAAIVYILYSSSAKKYYTGFTTLAFEERLQNHLAESYGKKFTSPFKDWEIFLNINCRSEDQARKIEAHIKKMKSSIYIKNLVKYPEMINNLIARFEK